MGSTVEDGLKFIFKNTQNYYDKINTTLLLKVQSPQPFAIIYI